MKERGLHRVPENVIPLRTHEGQGAIAYLTPTGRSRISLVPETAMRVFEADRENPILSHERRTIFSADQTEGVTE